MPKGIAWWIEPGVELMTKDMARLFPRVTVSDFSGQVALFMTEKACLQLSGLSDKDDFVKKHVENELYFPRMSSIKVVRRPSANADGKPLMIVVEAMEQDLTEPPTKNSFSVLAILKECPESTNGILSSSLQMLTKSPLYNLLVQYDIGDPKPCGKALVLIASEAKTKLAQIGDGYRMQTPGVTDVLAGEKATIVSFYSLETCTDYKLGPEKNQKVRYALLVVSMILGENTYLAESVHLVDKTDKDNITASLQKLISFTREAHVNGLPEDGTKKRSLQNASPESAQTCRRLGKSSAREHLAMYGNLL